MDLTYTNLYPAPKKVYTFQDHFCLSFLYSPSKEPIIWEQLFFTIKSSWIFLLLYPKRGLQSPSLP